MSSASYTPEELSEFDRLTLETTSLDQMTRIIGRGRLKTFIVEHGKAKCDAMFAELKRQDGEA